MKTATYPDNQDGNTILVTLMVITTLSVAVVSALNFTGGVARNVKRTNNYREAIELGDGVTEYLFANWREKCRSQPFKSFTGNELKDAIPLPDAGLFPGISDFSVSYDPDDTKILSNVRISGLDPTWTPVDNGAAVLPAYGGVRAQQSYFYLASANVRLPSSFGPDMRVRARRVLEKEFDSPWNYAIFYQDRLEIHPGPEFHVTGWVHTNEKLYTAHDSLWFESKVTSADDWNIAFAPGDGAHTGETPKTPHYPNDRPPLDGEPARQPFGADPYMFDTTDTNPNNDSFRELIEPPTSGFPDPFKDQRYYDQADVKIIVTGTDASPVITITNKAGTVVNASSTGTNKALYDTFFSATQVGNTIQDNRQAASIRLVTVDMSKINTALQPGGVLSGKGFGGVVYVNDSTASSTKKRGVRLKNGGIMPPGGLTVASGNPAYIQGDYNTGTVGATQPNSNAAGGDPTKNTVPGYVKQSSAVVADAVMVLSNNWVDANSTKPVAERVAKPTTINAAIVSGIVATGTQGTNYSGGAENFPRFMEKWGSGNTFTYYGSMVQLFESKEHTGVWGKSNVYDPPARKWYFDRQFYTDPPPGTLATITYKKGRWYLANE